MINIGKCPKCEKILNSVNLEAIDIKEGFQSAWHGVSYCCPLCHTVLSVQIDPVALKTDIIEGIAQKLRR